MSRMTTQTQWQLSRQHWTLGFLQYRKTDKKWPTSSTERSPGSIVHTTHAEQQPLFTTICFPLLVFRCLSPGWPRRSYGGGDNTTPACLSHAVDYIVGLTLATHWVARCHSKIYCVRRRHPPVNRNQTPLVRFAFQSLLWGQREASRAYRQFPVASCFSANEIKVIWKSLVPRWWLFWIEFKFHIGYQA